MFVKVSFRLKIGTLVDSNIMQLLPLDFAKSLVNELLNPMPAPQEMTEMIQNEAVQDCGTRTNTTSASTDSKITNNKLGFNQDTSAPIRHQSHKHHDPDSILLFRK